MKVLLCLKNEKQNEVKKSEKYLQVFVKKKQNGMKDGMKIGDVQKENVLEKGFEIRQRESQD